MPPESSYSSAAFAAFSPDVPSRLVEQLRYAQAVWEMLEAGTWSAAAGAQLEAMLVTLTADARQLGCTMLRRALLMGRRRLRPWVRRDRAPDPAAAADLHTQLAYALAAGQALIPPVTPSLGCVGDYGRCGNVPSARHREVSR